MLYAIALIVFAGVALAVWAVMRPTENIFRRRIRAESFREQAREIELESNLVRRVGAPLARKVGGLFARLVPKNSLRRLEHMLVMAGEPLSLPLYLAFWGGLVVFGGLVLFYIVLAKPDTSPIMFLMMTALVLALTAGSPYLILLRRVRNRQKSITRAMPDAIDLLVTCLEAGLGMDAAFAKVTEKTGGPLAEAFTLYLRQVGLGWPRRDALTQVAHRTGVRDLVRLASAVAHAEVVGSSLGDVFRLQAEDLRLARKARAQQAAHRAPVLMTLPLVLCFVPAMGIVIIVPTIISLMDFVNAL